MCAVLVAEEMMGLVFGNERVAALRGRGRDVGFSR
jgi:hypothetical protein